jgi:hypothetical protein
MNLARSRPISQLREAKNAIVRNNSLVNGCAGRSTSVVDEAHSKASDAEGYFFNAPFALGRQRMLGY